MTPTWAPSPDDVAALVPTRALTSLGTEPTFGPDTRPTAEQVEGLIVLSVRQLSAQVGDFDAGQVVNPSEVASGGQPVTLADLASDVASLNAAALLELTFFPEQVNTGGSPYPQLVEQAGVARLAFNRSAEVTGVAEADAIPQARAYFDVPAEPLGMSTRW